MSIPKNTDDLNDFIANALTNDIECVAGADEASVSSYNITDLKNPLTQWLIGGMLLLFILAMGNVIRDMLKKNGGVAPLKHSMAYLTIIFVLLAFADYIFAGVNNYPYMAAWGTVMFFIPVTLSAKYGFSGKFDNEVIDRESFTKFLMEKDLRLPIPRWIGLIIFLGFWVIGTITGATVQDTGRNADGTAKEHVGFIVFLVFTLVGMIIPVGILLAGKPE